MSFKESTIAISDEETDDNAVVSKLLKDVTLMMTEFRIAGGGAKARLREDASRGQRITRAGNSFPPDCLLELSLSLR